MVHGINHLTLHHIFPSLSSSLHTLPGMDFLSNTSSLDYGTNLTSPHIAIWATAGSQAFASSSTLGLSGLVTMCLGLLAYLSYTPKVDPRAPAFTKDTVPFIGSWRFFTQKMYRQLPSHRSW
jgi:hypothetical protein